jgi:hypothetical protein
MDIILNNHNYHVEDTKEKITIADSFVVRQNKIGGGNGEAKLYIGNESNELRTFYGQRGFNNQCFLLKEDILKYLYDCKYEYYHPTQPYKSQINMAELWEERMKKLDTLDEKICFTINEQEQITPPRIYIKSENQGFDLIRELSLPNLTSLSISKLQDSENNIIFYYKLHFYGIFENEERTASEILVDDVEDELEDVVLPLADVEDETDVKDEVEEFKPYDTEKISINTKPMPLLSCLLRMEQNTIILAPDFQRNEVWNIEKKSKLIESLLLKIPIPMFYVSADEKGTLSVVDGLQRLSTIRDFVLGKEYLYSNRNDITLKGNGFKLEKLEFWGEKYNNCTFNKLPIDMQNRILETELTFTIINPGTPEEVKRNIFKRINTGGEPLTPQEIRNALYAGQSTKILKELSRKKEFLAATDESVKNERMMDKELILRALAFIIRNYTSYPKNNDMDKYLSDTMRIINIMPNFDSKEALKFFKEEQLRKESVKKEDIQITDIEDIKAKFTKGMGRAKDIFKKHAFRKSYGKKRRTPINKALFEVWTVLLSNLNDNEYVILSNNKKDFLSEYNRLLDNINFNYFISRDSLKFNSVQERYKQLTTLLKKYTV